MNNRSKFISTLNIALHPTTTDEEIFAAIRGAYRLLGGKSVDQFLEQTQPPPPSDHELATKLHLAEQKLKGAVDYCNELKLQMINLQRGLSEANACRGRGYKRLFAFTGRHPVMSFCAASIVIGVMANQGKDRTNTPGQRSPSTVAMTTPQSSDTTPQPYAAVGGWDVEYSPRSKVCHMAKVYDSNTELVIGYNGVKYVMLLKVSDNIRDNNYKFNIQLHIGSQLPKREDTFVTEGKATSDGHSLLFSTLDPLFTTKFVTSTEITFWYQDKVFKTLFLSNQDNAWQAMITCQIIHS